MTFRSSPLVVAGEDACGSLAGVGIPAFIKALATATSARPLVKNFEARMYGLIAGNDVLPITVNDGVENTCLVSSPTEFYVRYAHEEIGRQSAGSVPLAIRLLNKLSLVILRLAKVDRIAYLNNWPVWTNPYPNLTDYPIGDITKLLVNRFPNHLIGFRSLNRVFHQEFLGSLENLGYLIVPANHTYVCDFRDPEWRLSRNLRRDLTILKDSKLYLPVEHERILPGDYSRIAWLYRQLNILKYTERNPQYTEDFFRVLHQCGVAKFFGFRSREGTLEAIKGDIDMGGIRINLFSGYNTNLETADGQLFRLLTAKIFEEALLTCDGLNLGAASAGAGKFKRLRGAKPTLEFNAYYVKHLSWLTNKLLTKFKEGMDSVGIAVMKRYDL